MSWIVDTNRAAEGERFYGRKEEIGYLVKMLLDGDRGACISLLGMNRIGKSSLVKEFIRVAKERGNKNLFLIYVDLQKVLSFWDFWDRVLQELFSGVSEMDPDYLEVYQDYKDYFSDGTIKRTLVNGDIYEDKCGKEKLEELFSIFTFSNIRVVIIADEFDCAGNAFGENEGNYGWLRGFLQEENHSLTSFVTVSRRSIYFIETHNYGGSTLDGMFNKYALFGYTYSEIGEMFEKVKEVYPSISDEERDIIGSMCGKSPCYWAQLGQYLMNENIGQRFDHEYFRYKLITYYDAITRMLEEEKLFTAMLQAFVGPVYNLRRTDLDRLTEMGICIRRSTLQNRMKEEDYIAEYSGGIETEYITVNEDYIDYLKEHYQFQIDNIWPVLTAAEKKCRATVRKVLMDKYGTMWETQIEKYFKPKDKANLNHHNERYSKASREARSMVGNSLLNVASWKCVASIIDDEWQQFESIFSGFTKNELIEAMSGLLYDARNTTAHSNGELMDPAEVEKVENICGKIIDQCDSYNK